MKITRLPRDDATNGWSAILPPRRPRPALASDAAADWVVIGAGYAGLAAARRLAENRPDDAIVLVEAGAVGENASGRNSGFAIDLPHNVGSSLEELDASHSYLRLARGAIDTLENLVKAHAIPCEWSTDGKYHAAVSSKGRADVLEPLARELDALKEPYDWVEGDDLAAKLGTEHFTAAIYTPGGALMNPAALTRGLADALPANVTLFENTPVTDFARDNGFCLTTPGGRLRAPKAILATNGFTERFGAHQNKFIHVVAHASLTRPLDDDEMAAIGNPKPWGLTPANAFAGITMRLTNDRRILIRHGLAFCPSQRVSDAELQAAVRRHRTLFAARFPPIAHVELAHSWSGFVCLSRNAAPAFGAVGPGLWTACCQNAVGVTKGTIGGLLAADLACDRDNPLIADMHGLGTPDRLPPRPFFDVGVRTRFALELWRNRHEA